ncbi:MAG TPA: hypothetical protein IAC37_07770 [Candidatus Ventrimonas merdavium]|nr:hypothetical protein [Candidatus Ventrimonas merdavium]
MNKIVFGLFLLAAAGQDIRKKQVDMWIYLVFGCAAAGLLVFHMLGGGIWLDGMRGISDTELTTEAGSDWQYLTDALTGGTLGLGLLGIGMVSGGSVGSGDGLFFFISGLLLGFWENLLLLCYGSLCCAVFCLGYLVWKKLRKGQWAGRETVPFLPFAAMPGIWLLLQEAGVLMR